MEVVSKTSKKEFKLSSSLHIFCSETFFIYYFV
jgi:hypothetical protein